VTSQVTLLPVFVLLAASGSARAATPGDLVRAYPEALSDFDGSDLIWRDGTRMPVGQAQPGRSEEEVLRHASIADQLAGNYPAGAPMLPPEDDPGRARNRSFFDKMYGDCRAGRVTARLVQIVWLPRTWWHRVSVTSVNGLDRALEAVSRELDELPAEDKKYLYPLGGTYNCRSVIGTEETSMHSWAAAIDINPVYSDYWRWNSTGNHPVSYRNRIPAEVVAVFERHGFIWGGRWAHFDTMHFEYRPEMLGYLPGLAE
jgi:hypothetical protein